VHGASVGLPCASRQGREHRRAHALPLTLDAVDDGGHLVDRGERAVGIGVVRGGDVLFDDAGVRVVVALGLDVARLDSGDLLEVGGAVLAIDVPGEAVGLVAEKAPAEEDAVRGLRPDHAAREVLHGAQV
jgi:hypothetical protein